MNDPVRSADAPRSGTERAAPAVHPGARRARWAVCAVFFTHGAAVGTWVSEIPAVQARLGLGEGQLGLALAGPGIGALVGSQAGGRLVSRWGSRRVSAASALLLCASLLLVPFATGAGTLLACLLVLGAADAAMDVGMNSQTVELQRAFPRPILNGMHATRSLGAVAGALGGSLAIALGLPVRAHLALVAVALAALVFAAARWLLSSDGAARRPGAARAPGGLRQWRAVGPLALLAFLAAVVSDIPASWGGVYLKDLGAAGGVAAAAYAVYSCGEILGRLAGDRAVARYGWARLIRAGAVGTAVAVALALPTGHAPLMLVVLGLTGLGISVTFPGAFAGAGSLPGVAQGAAIGQVTFAGRLGWMAVSPLVGGLATVFGLTVALAVLPLAALAIAFLAPVTEPGR
ncbi:MFS transporter [Streptomyces capparidis]